MINNSLAGGLKRQMTDEIHRYCTEVISVGEAYDFSQYRLVRRITIFESHTYPTGKFDSQGNYKYWFDIISSRIENEVKNIDFDTKDVKVYSDRSPKDDLAVLITNLKLKEYLRETEQDEEFNDAIEEGSGWGNVVWKNTATGYERCDLKNIYVINQTARELSESPVIERHEFTTEDLKKKKKVWDAKAIDDLLKLHKEETTKPQIQSVPKITTIPYFDVYERNGEVCLKDLKEANGEQPSPGDEDRYVFAKVIGSGAKGQATGVSIDTILFAQEMKGKTNEDIYEEFHRSAYKGVWFRKGMYEILFDLQVRANQIGNQLAQGLEFASKVVLFSEDKLIVQNILTDMKSGDIIRTKQLTQVPLVMQAFQHLIEEWNRIQQHANDLANSSPIVTGEGLPQRMPFQVAALLNQNANKLFDYIRQKLAIPFTHIFENWIVPECVKSLSAKEILELTGDEKMLDRVRQMIVDNWYLENLLSFPPHSQDVEMTVKQQQMDLLKKRPKLLMTGIKQVFKDFQPSVSCVITGENSTLPQDMQTLSTFIGLETDPVRRTALIEMAMAKKGIDTASLPKSAPADMIPQGGAPGGGKPPAINGNTNLPARPHPPVRGKVAVPA